MRLKLSSFARALRTGPRRMSLLAHSHSSLSAMKLIKSDVAFGKRPIASSSSFFRFLSAPVTPPPQSANTCRMPTCPIASYVQTLMPDNPPLQASLATFLVACATACRTPTANAIAIACGAGACSTVAVAFFMAMSSLTIFMTSGAHAKNWSIKQVQDPGGFKRNSTRELSV